MKHPFLLALCLNLYFLRCLALDDSRNARILYYRFENNGAGPYNFSFETSDGIKKEETARLEHPNSEDEALVVRGSYSYTDGTGKLFKVRYTADSNGFHPEGDHIKVPPFVPWTRHHQEAHSPPTKYLPSTPKPKPSRLYVPTTTTVKPPKKFVTEKVTTTLRPPPQTVTEEEEGYTSTPLPVRIDLIKQQPTIEITESTGAPNLQRLVPLVQNQRVLLNSAPVALPPELITTGRFTSLGQNPFLAALLANGLIGAGNILTPQPFLAGNSVVSSTPAVFPSVVSSTTVPPVQFVTSTTSSPILAGGNVPSLIDLAQFDPTNKKRLYALLADGADVNEINNLEK